MLERLLVTLTWYLHQIGQRAEGTTYRLYDAAQLRCQQRTGWYWLPATREWWDGR